MAFFTKKDIGRLYVIRMEMPDETIVHKIGMCKTSRATDRMMEILRSWFVNYRFIPHTTLRLDMETAHPLALESHIHKILYRHQFIPDKKVDGATEMFTDINEFRLLQYLRRFDDRMLESPLNLSSKEYSLIGQWLAPAC